MFLHLFDKVYLVTSEPKKWNNDIKITNFDRFYYHDFRDTFLNLEAMFSYLMKSLKNQTNDLTLLVLRNEAPLLIRDYFEYLGLDEGALRCIQEYSSQCDEYMENSDCIDKIPELDEDIVLRPSTRKSIRKDYDRFPAELAINCLDQSWAREKYEWFRIYDLFNEIKNEQHRLIREGKPIPVPLTPFKHHDRFAKPLLEDAYFSQSLKGLEASMGQRLERFHLPLEEYVATWPSFGYNQYHFFKYNYPLARYIKEKGYRIDG